MNARLDIHLHGASTESGALSLASFAPALAKLVRALRVTASQIQTAADRDRSSSSGGRITREAQMLDLQLTSVKPSTSVDLVFACVAPPVGPGPMALPLRLASLSELAAQRLVSDIQNEAAGRRCNAAARGYLRALPTGLEQRYDAFDRDGHPLAVAEVTALGADDRREGLPGVRVCVGAIAELGFESGREFITLRSPAHGRLRVRVTPEQVQDAVSLRDAEVRAVVRRDGKELRLLRVDAVDRDVAGSPESRWAQIAQRWDAVLERLAQ